MFCIVQSIKTLNLDVLLFMKAFLTRAILFFLVTCLISQNSLKGQYSEMSFGLGIANYWGDLNAESLGTNLRQSRIAGSVDYIYSLNKYLNVRGSISGMRLGADDRFNESLKKRQRNLNFKTTLIEAAVIAEFHFFGFEYRNPDLIMSPYLLGGIGGFYFDPVTVYNGQKVNLQPLGTEGQGISGYEDPYSLISVAAPFGVGMKFKPSDRVCFSIEGLMRYTLTDYIDDVSNQYVDYGILLEQNGELAAYLGERIDEFRGLSEGSISDNFVGQQRGNPSINDYYLTAMLKIQIYLGDGFRSPMAMFRSHKTYCPTF